MQEYALMIQDAHTFSNLKVSCKAKLEIELSWEVNVEQISWFFLSGSQWPSYWRQNTQLPGVAGAAVCIIPAIRLHN